MSDDLQDEDLARAIALSLQDVPGPAPRPPLKKETDVIEISDDEDEDRQQEHRFQQEIQRAMEASKKEEGQEASQSSRESPNPTTSFLSERAKLEQQRLARQKRLRPDLDIDGSPGRDDGTPKPKRQHLFPSSAETRRADVHAYSSATSSRPVSSRGATASTSSSRSSEQWFWNGEMRQIANAHVDPTKDAKPTFRLSEILAPRDDMVFAIVSAYVYNFPWLYSMIKPEVPVIAVAQDPQGLQAIRTILPNWIKTTPFLRNGMGCMHMKFMLLFYQTGRLRIVVTTANMIEYDWRDIENTTWVQDLPKRPSPVAHDPKADDFPASFVRVLHALNVAPALSSHINHDHRNIPLHRLEHLRTHWDFSKVKAKLIPSIAGKHEGWPNVILAGHTCLMKALRDSGLAVEKGKEVVLECQGSSIGTYSTQWMNEFHCSARGQSAQTWLDIPKGRRTKLPYPPIKILFPTVQYVRDSVAGERGGGTMFCRRNQWEGAKFPRDLFHQSRSKRGRVLMHSKMILGIIGDKSAASGNRSDSETESEDDAPSSSNAKAIGWLYMGSHNFTPSAWGTLSGSAFNPTLNITNYELGIVLPVQSQEEANRLACWERPPCKYVLGKDEPWIQSESPAFAQDIA